MFFNKKNDAILTAGLLAKSGKPYQMALLNADDIGTILNLQKTAMDELTEEEKSYLVPKDRAFFEKHFANENLVLGVVADGKLIAQSVILNPTRKNPKTGMTDMPGRLKPQHLTVIQGVIVHPDYRGNRLMSVMVDAWLDIARHDGRRHAIAEVTAENHFSWSVFMKEGLNLHSIGYDSDDAVQLYNMHTKVGKLIKLRLSNTFNAAAERTAMHIEICPAHDIDKQRRLLKKGFQGVARDVRTGDITFAKADRIAQIRNLLKWPRK